MSGESRYAEPRRQPFAFPRVLLRMYAWGNVSDFSGSEMTAGAAGQAKDGLARQAVVLGSRWSVKPEDHVDPVLQMMRLSGASNWS